MYAYEWDSVTGGYNLTPNILTLSGEIRPVFFEELIFLGMNKLFGWQFPSSKEPLCWAEGRRYFYRGELVAETQGGNLFGRPSLKNVTANLLLTPVDVSAMLGKNEDLLTGMVQKTLKDIYGTYTVRKDEVDFFYAAFSGGKDSTVMLDLIQRALPHDSFEVIFGDTTMELGDTYRAVAAAQKFFADLKWHTARAPFAALDSWRFMGPPSRQIRWCCPVHKSGPSLAKVKELIAEQRHCSVGDVKDFRAMAAFVGVRAEESGRRSTYDKIAMSRKHAAQINFYPILKWSSAEIFLCLFSKNLPFSQSYRNGLPRVGCKLCPLSSKLNDCLQNNFYAEELAPLIGVVKQSIDKGFESAEQWRDYLNDQGWKKRSGGRILTVGQKKVETLRGGNRYDFILSGANYSWRKWLPVLGDFFSIGADKFSLQYEGKSIIFNVSAQANKEILSFQMSVLDGKAIKFFRLLRKVLNKAAYCSNCRVCVIECPHCALIMTGDDVQIRNCRHCYRCLAKPNGCLAADSLKCGGEEKGMKIKGIDSHKTFGLRAEWIKILFEDPQSFWSNERMGSKMFESFRSWGREVGLLADIGKFATNMDKLVSLGAESLKLWGMFWVNAAYRSALVNFFVKKADFYTPLTDAFFIDELGDAVKERTKRNGLAALKNLFKDSPIGRHLGQGYCEMKGRTVVSIKRAVWQNPEPLVILYSLYCFAAHADNLYSFTLTELITDSGDREALSPKILFGLDEEILRPLLQGLAGDYPNFIRVDFNKGIMENIFLNRDKTSEDVIDLF